MCKKLGKQARLTLIGEDTEVDKPSWTASAIPSCTLCATPWTTVSKTRPRADRRRQRPGGTDHSVRPSHRGEVIIEVRTTARGVNYDAVLNKAIRQGQAVPDGLFPLDILNFLLAPGFSTNTEVTEFSGRGVGMDVVRKNVEDVGGTVSITSEPGQGMTTTLKIP